MTVVENAKAIAEYGALVRSFWNEYNETRDQTTGKELLRVLDEMNILLGRFPHAGDFRPMLDQLMMESKRVRENVIILLLKQ